MTFTDDDLFAALGNFLTLVLPTGTDVLQGQANRVAEPTGQNFVVMWPTGRTRLSTNTKATAGPPPGPSPDGTVTFTQATEFQVQIDAHGERGADNAQIITTLLRSPYAVDQMGPTVAPLFTSDPTQMPFLNGEQEYEDRWVILAHFQANPAVSTPAQFADTLTAIIATPADIRRVA